MHIEIIKEHLQQANPHIAIKNRCDVTMCAFVDSSVWLHRKCTPLHKHIASAESVVHVESSGDFSSEGGNNSGCKKCIHLRVLDIPFFTYIIWRC